MAVATHCRDTMSGCGVEPTPRTPRTGRVCAKTLVFMGSGWVLTRWLLAAPVAALSSERVKEEAAAAAAQTGA